MGNPPASSVFSRLGIIGLPSVTIDATRTYGHTLFQLRKNPKMGEWIASKDTPFYRRGIVLLAERWEK